MHGLLIAALIGGGAATCLAGKVGHRRARAHRLSGRQPRPGPERRARLTLFAGISALSIGLALLAAG
jgi:hypothetical protein